MKILSFGEMLWDVYEDKKCLGGAPLNFAAHCSMLGARSWLVSAVGDDELGKTALKETKAYGVDTEYVSVLTEKETGKCLVSLSESVVPSYNVLDDVAHDYIKMPELKENFDVIAFGTLALRHKNNRNVLAQIIKKHSFGEVFADVNIRAPFYSEESIRICLSNATVLKISEEELPTVTEEMFGEALSNRDAAKKIVQNYSQVKIIIITMGKNGSLCYDCKTGEFFSVDAEPVEVVSTVGAGDGFGAAFLVKYKESKDCRKSLAFATKISAFICTKTEAVPRINATELL